MSITIERTTLTQLVNNEQYARKVLPFIKKDYFSDKTEKTIFEEITLTLGIVPFLIVPLIKAKCSDPSNKFS